MQAVLPMRGTAALPGYLEPVRYEITLVPDDPDAMTAATLALMGRYAVQDAGTPEIQSDVAMIRSMGGYFPADAWSYVRSRVGFVPDEITAAPFQTPAGDVLESLVRPVDMSSMSEGAASARQGDCDDFSMWLASILIAAGYDAHWVTVAARPESPDQYSHVYVACYDGPDRIALDASHGPYAGWETPRAYRRREWPVRRGIAAPILIAIAIALSLWLRSKP